MAKRRKFSGILIYNLLMKEVTAINRNLPETRKLSVRDRREFISKKLYPTYKNYSLNKIPLKPLRADLVRKIQRLPRKKSCNVLLIPPDSYTAKDYFIADGFLNETLQCINIKFDAGEFGSTKIFNTRDHDYYSAGVKEITDALNKWCTENRTPSDDLPVYNGKVQLMPGRQDDGKEESYFLDMILYIDDMPVAEFKELVIKKVKKKTLREERLENNVKKYLREKIGELIAEKTKVKRVRRKIITDIRGNATAVKAMSSLIKKKLLPEGSIEKANKFFVKKQTDYVNKYYKLGTINKRQRDELLKTIADGIKNQQGKKKKK